MKKILTDAKFISGQKTTPPRDSEVLVLTPNIRTSQQRNGLFTKRKPKYGTRAYMYSSPPKFCNRYSSVFLYTDEKGKPYLARLKGFPCNSWRCSVCRPFKAKRLRRLLVEVIKLNNLDHLLTLTLESSKVPKKYSNKTGIYATYLFNRFRGIIVRKMRKGRGFRNESSF